MSRYENIQSLKEEFPDMTQSVIGDVLSTYGNDLETASTALNLIQESLKEDQKAKVDELKGMFDNLPEEVIKKALSEAGWNVESAIVPLFTYIEHQKQVQHSRSQQKKLAKEKKKKATEIKEKVNYLMDMFYSLPKEVVQKILEDNEGDIESTTVELLAHVKQVEEQKNKEREEKIKREQELQLRELKINVLKEKFPELSENEILAALDATKWDIKTTSLSLFKTSMEKKKQTLKCIFKNHTDQTIESALERANWDVKKASQELSSETTVEKKPSSPSFFEQSLILEQEIEQELTTSTMALVKREKQQKEEVNTVFLENLEKIIATQARSGEVPGISPPLLPKQIDVRLQKDRPVKEEDMFVEIQEDKCPEPVKPVEEKPKTVPSASANVVLSVHSELVDAGNDIRVNWKVLEGTTTSWDWIGLFALDKQNKEYLTYQWRGKDETQGSLTFVAPKVYGEYEFRYFPSGSYQHLSRSPKFLVGPKFELEATFDETKNHILVKWTQKSGNPYSNAWIGLYEKSQSNNSLYLTWEYAAKTNNQVSFVSPLKPGDYEARFFPYSYIDVSRSNVITVEGNDILKAVVTPEGDLVVETDILSIDPYWESAWLGIYLTAEHDNRCWRRYKHIKERKGLVNFKLPRVQGEYEVRLFANKTYNIVARSNPFQILPKDI